VRTGRGWMGSVSKSSWEGDQWTVAQEERE
jgi:hypothetical protein